jgi:glutamine synthetase
MLDHSVRDHFMTLEHSQPVYQAEYVWIGGSGRDLRSKTRTLSNDVPQDPAKLPIWNFDGSSTGQAPGNDSEVLLKPQRVFRDPFRRGNNVLVICDCYKPDMSPIPGNTRILAERIFAQKPELHPWFGIEQEYVMFTSENWPIGWPKGGYPGEQGPYYCSAGAENSFGRDLAEAHYRACLFAGIKISGINAEVLPGQWEFQVGPCEGLEMGDSLIAARYIMARLGEDFGIRISYDPKPIPGDWNGSGAHCNYSTEETRAPGGIAAIKKYCERLGKRHVEHIQAYGEGNERRLSGLHETAPIDRFSFGVANRGASIRIPREADRNGCGYMEDRRPAANSDPYLVTALIYETTCLLNL